MKCYGTIRKGVDFAEGGEEGHVLAARTTCELLSSDSPLPQASYDYLTHCSRMHLSIQMQKLILICCIIFIWM